MNKKANSPENSSNAAFLILIIAVIIVFYILFLSPEDRATLLDTEGIPGTPTQISGGYSHLVGTTPFSQKIGHIDYVRESTIQHELSSFRIFTQTDANVITDVSSLYVKNSAFEKKGVEVPFSVDEDATDNVMMTFNVYRSSGGLRIYLNGETLFEGELKEGTPPPISIPNNLLKKNNILYFSATSPGFAFWTMHQYELTNVRLTGDITDSSNNFNVQKIYIGQSEFDHMKKATIEFYPDCSVRESGRLTVSINGETVYYGTPDCGVKNYFEIGKPALIQGENKLEFISDGGSYIIDMLELDVELEDPEYPMYYFEMDEDLFVDVVADEYCGKIDGVCPTNCEPYDDKDCCFTESRNNYWCDIRPINPRDRCVNSLLAEFGENCPSGYEDRNGDPHEDLEGVCGDDTDEFCPIGCSSIYDKDCCYAIADGAYWCEDVPFTGMDSTCSLVVTLADCDACPDGFENEDGDEPNCPTSNTLSYEDDPVLKSGVDVVLEAYFTNKEYKKVDFVINGQEIPIDTYNLNVFRNINPFVREGTNTLEIQPRKDITIAQVKVVIE